MYMKVGPNMIRKLAKMMVISLIEIRPRRAMNPYPSTIEAKLSVHHPIPLWALFNRNWINNAVTCRRLVMLVIMISVRISIFIKSPLIDIDYPGNIGDV